MARQAMKYIRVIKTGKVARETSRGFSGTGKRRWKYVKAKYPKYRYSKEASHVFKASDVESITKEEYDKNQDN